MEGIAIYIKLIILIVRSTLQIYLYIIHKRLVKVSPFLCKIEGYHNTYFEDSCLLGCYTEQQAYTTLLHSITAQTSRILSVSPMCFLKTKGQFCHLVCQLPSARTVCSMFCFIQHLCVVFPRHQNLFILNVFMSGRMIWEFVLEEITCAAICSLYSLNKILYLINLCKSTRPVGINRWQ